MQISRYSAPEFDPYGEARQTEPDDGWRAPVAVRPLDAVLALPGSKSLTNRELVLAALADDRSNLRAPLWSRDSELMIDGLRALGTGFDPLPGTGGFGADLRVIPAAELLGSTTIDCGLAGTVMRFLPPVAALALGPTTFDGDEGARRRPMGASIQALRALGVDLEPDLSNAAPFLVAALVAGGRVTITGWPAETTQVGAQLAQLLPLFGARVERDADRLTVHAP